MIYINEPNTHSSLIRGIACINKE